MSRSQLLPRRMKTASIAGAREGAKGLKGIGIAIVRRGGRGSGAARADIQSSAAAAKTQVLCDVDV